jgi:hypothetical protein
MSFLSSFFIILWSPPQKNITDNSGFIKTNILNQYVAPLAGARIEKLLSEGQEIINTFSQT